MKNEEFTDEDVEKMIRRRLGRLGRHRENARDICQRAAELAHTCFFPIRFGYFRGSGYFVMFSNMGFEAMPGRDAFRRRLEALGQTELAVANWPREAPYTWAVLVKGNVDGEWLRELVVETHF